MQMQFSESEVVEGQRPCVVAGAPHIYTTPGDLTVLTKQGVNAEPAEDTTCLYRVPSNFDCQLQDMTDNVKGSGTSVVQRQGRLFFDTGA